MESLAHILKLSRTDRILLVSSHDIGFLHSFVDSFIVMDKGKIIEAIPNENAKYDEVNTAYASCIGDQIG